jgi:hypothetical protein
MFDKLMTYTRKQLERLYIRVWDKMTRYDGYQPFGYDAPTLWATHPEYMNIIQTIKAVAKRQGWTSQ